MKIGIIGCGAVGQKLSKNIQKFLSDEIEIYAICDVDQTRANEVARSLEKSPKVYQDYKQLIKDVDFVIEVATGDVVPDILYHVTKMGKKLMVLSVGGLLKVPDISKLIQESDSNLYVPSGAIAGLDGFAALKHADIRQVTLTTRKPPKGLKGAPFLQKKSINLDLIQEETCVFEGTAFEAVEAFPKNANVAATISLAGIGPDKTKVCILTDPKWTCNSHEIEVISDAGRMVMFTENHPDPDNPKTSYIVTLSALALLEKFFEGIKIGV
ncbi:hypothetical protein AB834_01805 [PVC group bacterium (ex Bugula neritina AB1)]|nr:hypothetical protein AB834_01805 [PVC group bacterium (ex Bugula neritina AB1)]